MQIQFKIYWNHCIPIHFSLLFIKKNKLDLDVNLNTNGWDFGLMMMFIIVLKDLTKYVIENNVYIIKKPIKLGKIKIFSMKLLFLIL